jgi:pyroglutamyl-peptidase
MSTRRYIRRSNGTSGDPHTTVLITAFGPFPGVPVNATMRLVPELAESATLAFPDVRFVIETLATEWQAAPRRLAAVIAEVKPDLILHFGVSSRARGFEIEQRAHNACRSMPDAAGVLPRAATLRDGGADVLRTSLPVPHLVLALKRRGIPAYASRDAGAYLCNAVLYHSLQMAADRLRDCRVGFVHVPASLARPGGPNRGRVGACPLTWPQAVEGGLEIIAGCLGRPLPKARAHAVAGARMQISSTARFRLTLAQP